MLDQGQKGPNDLGLDGISQDFLVFICRMCWAFCSSPSVQLKDMGHVGHSVAILDICAHSKQD